MYNERPRVGAVLDALVQIEGFDQIIVVDDGSDDGSLALLEEYEGKYDQIQVLVHQMNAGKSQAVKTALECVQTAYVFLFDADLADVDPDELQWVIDSMYADLAIGMGLLRRVQAQRHIKLLYRELVLSGERMLRADDLRAILDQ